MSPTSDFDDLLAANRAYADTYTPTERTGAATRRLAILTCMDSRIEPLAMLGLVPGDAKIMRNAGARVTPDSLRSLILATHLLDVDRIAVIAHTDCRMTTATQAEIAAAVGDSEGEIDYLPIADQEATLREDVATLRAHPLIRAGTRVDGFVYDVHSGALRQAT